LSFEDHMIGGSYTNNLTERGSTFCSLSQWLNILRVYYDTREFVFQRTTIHRIKSFR